VDLNGLKKAFISIVKALFYGLTKQPTIVFNNGETVVYGFTDPSLSVAVLRLAFVPLT
jgi:hypothetical protein